MFQVDKKEHLRHLLLAKFNCGSSAAQAASTILKHLEEMGKVQKFGA